MTHLNGTALGLSLGILWGGGLFILCVIAMFSGYGVEVVDLLGKVYLGTAGSWLGAFLGLAWGFADGFVGGFLLAWLYNRFS